MVSVATVGTIYGCYIIQTEFSRLRPNRIIRVECLNFCSTTMDRISWCRRIADLLIGPSSMNCIGMLNFLWQFCEKSETPPSQSKLSADILSSPQGRLCSRSKLIRNSIPYKEPEGSRCKISTQIGARNGFLSCETLKYEREQVTPTAGLFC